MQCVTYARHNVAGVLTSSFLLNMDTRRKRTKEQPERHSLLGNVSVASRPSFYLFPSATCPPSPRNEVQKQELRLLISPLPCPTTYLSPPPRPFLLCTCSAILHETCIYHFYTPPLVKGLILGCFVSKPWATMWLGTLTYVAKRRINVGR